ncbi:MAG: long-chain-acyl-CoA synthetase [Candidatus Helarchaeota archaeon]|nr:long-chain-acyl-CoA synthetase [Candidatus Helarchaeota archaeon]
MVRFSPKEVELYGCLLQEVQKLHDHPDQGIGTRIEQLAKEMPQDISLYYQDDHWTWQALNEESNRISNYFSKAGLGSGETIALMLENSPEYLFSTIGINKIQGISALININQRKQALTHSFKIANSKMIVVDGDCLPAFNEIMDTLPHKHTQIFVINNTEDIPHDFIDLPSELKTISGVNPKTTGNSTMRQTALYIFTSGTTGLPKAVVMQHIKLFTTGLLIGAATARLTPNDVVYIFTPLYHNLALGTAWMAAILTGAKTALRKRFSASNFWKDVHKYKATLAMYVGSIPRYLLNQPVSPYEKNHNLKVCGLGLRKQIWEQFKNRFQIENIWEFYGSTEGHRPFMNIDEVPGMIGRCNMTGVILAKVDPETGIFYKDENGYLTKCIPGDTGMLLLIVEGRGIFTGYKNKEKTESKLIHNCFREGDAYFNTGDMLTLHDDNWLSFADRFGDTYRWKGENVSTLEVEEILNSYEAIEMSAVYGVAIPHTEGKAGMAAIKIRRSYNLDLDNFSKFVLDILPGYSIPVFLRLRKKFEFTGPLKLRKFKIRQEGYNIENIQDPLFFWDSTLKQYVSLTNKLYQNILEGKVKI